MKDKDKENLSRLMSLSITILDWFTQVNQRVKGRPIYLVLIGEKE